MMDLLKAFDVDSYNKPGFDFGLAKQAGYNTGYVKLGGDNLSPRYEGTGYKRQFQKMVDAGIENRGSYWVSGGFDPVGSAHFYLDHLDPRTTFDVLDNEKLDNGRPWTDAEASAFFDVLIAAGRTNLFQYGSRDSLWNAGSWGGLAARKIKAIVAFYNGVPFTNIMPRTYPTELVFGHQFTSSSPIGGLGDIDENVFLASAFGPTTASTITRSKELGEIMSAIHLSGVKDSGIIIRGSDVPYSMEESVFVATANGLGLSIIELAQWQYDTVVREQWTAHASSVQFSNTSVDPKDVDTIVSKIRESFPAPTHQE